MAITRTPIIDDNGTGTTGTIINNAWKQELYGQIDAADAAGASPAWSAIPFNAADYTASGGGTWTVTGANMIAALLSNKLLFVTVFISASNLVGTAGSLNIKIPLGKVVGNQCIGSALVASASSGGFEITSPICATSGTAILINRNLLQAFAAGAVSGYVSILIPVN